MFVISWDKKAVPSREGTPTNQIWVLAAVAERISLLKITLTWLEYGLIQIKPGRQTLSKNKTLWLKNSKASCSYSYGFILYTGPRVMFWT